MKNKKEKLLLFFDTEFTDFTDMDLISIGIVSKDGHEFYAENTDFNIHWCNDFVRAEVLTRLEGGEFAMSFQRLKEKLQLWISDLLEEYKSVLFIYDYSGDWRLLNDLLNDYPQLEKVENERDDLDAGIELYFMIDQTNQHHALHDAKALLNGYKVKYKGENFSY